MGGNGSKKSKKKGNSSTTAEITVNDFKGKQIEKILEDEVLARRFKAFAKKVPL